MPFHSETETAAPASLDGLAETWLPFTPNRYFKQQIGRASCRERV